MKSEANDGRESPAATTPRLEALTQESLALVRHELRTPINAILGYGELLLEDLEEDPSHPLAGDLDQLHVRTKSLLDEINRALDNSQFLTGRIDLRDVRDTAARLGQPAGSIERLADHLVGRTERTEPLRPDLVRIRTAARQLATMLANLADSESVAGQDALQPPEAPTPLPPPVTSGEQVRAQMAPGRVLVVDDNEANRDVLGRYLTRQGHDVDFAENGKVALEKAVAGTYDLILLDILMPEIDGREVLRRLRAAGLLARTPVIVISAMDDIQAVADCIKLGAEDCLRKPFDHVLLRARVRAGLEKKRLREREEAYLEEIKLGKEKADHLLHLLYPSKIVEELKSTGRVKPRLYQHVAVFFADLVGFTAYCQEREPDTVLRHLQTVDDAFEELTLEHGLEKIKTIGDAFMAAAGLLQRSENPVLECVRCGLAFVDRLAASNLPWNVRVGIHVGPLIAGIVGRRKCLFDVWGATVNTAARVESNGDAGSVNVSEQAWREIESRCLGRSLGQRQMKGIGALEIFQVQGMR